MPNKLCESFKDSKLACSSVTTINVYRREQKRPKLKEWKPSRRRMDIEWRIDNKAWKPPAFSRSPRPLYGLLAAPKRRELNKRCHDDHRTRWQDSRNNDRAGGLDCRKRDTIVSREADDSQCEDEREIGRQLKSQDIR